MKLIVSSSIKIASTNQEWTYEIRMQKKKKIDKINNFAYSGLLELFNAMKYPSNRNLE